MDAARYWLLVFAIFLIRTMNIFRPIELPETRRLLAGIPNFRVLPSRAMIQRLVIEIYTATKPTTRSSLHSAQSTMYSLPIFHLGIDLWTSSLSHVKYMGVQLFFVDANFNFVSKLLAIRAFQPSTELLENADRMSAVHLIWLKGVLEEFGLKEDTPVSSTTDSESDIKRLCDVLPCPWDWSISHMLNSVPVEGFGTALQKVKDSKNMAARELIKKFKKVIENVN